jgi:hypothetical protein
VPGPEAQVAPHLRHEPVAVPEPSLVQRGRVPEPPLDQEAVPAARDLGAEAGGVERPPPFQLARALPPESRELEQPSPAAAARAQQELAALQVEVAGGPIRLARVAERAPAAAGDLLGRALRLAHQVRHPGREPVLRSPRGVEQ